MTVVEFLAWEERQELRDEFDGFQPLAMTDGTDRHEAIGGMLRALLSERSRGRPCHVRGPTPKIEVAGRIRYPDAFVYCSPPVGGGTVSRDPVVVVEIVSEGTSRIDRIDKLRDCQAAPSIRRCVMLEQDTIAASVFARQGKDWIATALTEADRLEMPEIDAAIALADIYADIALP